MATIKYKTRNMSNPQGKPRVYFCCHPEDFDRYFEPISEELLAKQNCAVYYLEDPNAVRDEELFADLGQMQLFVMPVTTRLLCSENSALTQEFPFAMASHIPVLPLMQEGGLEELFNQKCGDLQFLDKHNLDATAISYEEKLDKYLSSVLIGDELAEKIRAAFDAYVFLSYRKKDRKYAQELMRLIHKNDFCRDIAIWYDEFLTPGEDFNDAIEGALRKSGLFVLAVTPNLVNEINYIMTTEYPMARREGKPILPAELVPTDRAQLEAKYEGIPACTDANDETLLSQALLAQVRQMAIKENDASPEHNFFIGLAYLGGVDVEVDHQRAVALITGAAEAGLVEATEKLVELYRTGMGVERNYETAVQWQEKVVEQTRRAYEEQPGEERLDTFFWAAIRCGDYYKELGRLAKAKEYYGWVTVEYKTALSRRNRSVGYDRLGDICLAEGDLSGAREYYAKGLAIAEELAKETGAARHDLAINYEKLGNICRAEGDLSGARGHYAKSLAIFEELAKETGTVEARRDMAVSYSNLGDICLAEGDLSGAREYYAKSLAIFEALAEETGTLVAWRDLSVSYERLGNSCDAEGDQTDAWDHYTKVLAISEALAEETGTVDARRNLAVGYVRVGDICLEEGDLSGAREYYTKGFAIAEELAKETGTVLARQNLSISYNRLGDICRAEGDLSSAREYYAKSLAIREELAKETGTVEARRDLAISYGKMGRICEVEGDLSGTRRHYTKSLAIFEELAKETGMVEARRDLSVIYDNLGDICRAEGDLVGAREYYIKSLTVREELAKETGTVEARRDLAVSCNNLGNICLAEGNLIGARGHYTKSLALAEKLAKETGTLEARRDLSVNYEKLGDICRAEGDLPGAREYYAKSLAIREELAKETGTVQSYDDLGVSHYNMHCICGSEETDYLGKAIAIYEKLCAACPDVERYRNNLKALKSLRAE